MKSTIFTSINTRAKKLLAASSLLFSAQFAGAQTHYTFTPAGATGSAGPTQTQVNSAYVGTNLDNSVTVIGQGIQQFTIPVAGEYGILAVGAQGYGPYGGRGASIYGKFNFSAGQVLNILVGQKGAPPIAPGTNQYGGGGGSFVTDLSNSPFVVAGGGGGSWANNYTSTTDATTLTSGNAGANGPTNGAGGTGGGGGASAGLADGGGGLTGDGGGVSGGKAYVNGGLGGADNGHGGFGGGGGASSQNNRRGGGGGGYSGGGGAGSTTTGFPEGGGGGSYNGGTDQVNQGGTNVGDGYVVVTRLCAITMDPSSNPICRGASVTMTTNATGGISWSSGGTSTTEVVSPTVTTTYSVIGTSTANCTTTVVLTVTVNTLPSLTAVAVPSVICSGSTGSLHATGAAQYTWVPGVLLAPMVTVNPVATTVYTVTGANVFGCKSTQTVVATVNNAQLAVSANTTVCSGQPAYLSASGADSYQWSNGSIFPNTIVHPTVTTNYVVSGIDMHGCAISNTITVAVNGNPVLDLSATRSVVCRGETVELSATGAVTYTWSHGDSGSTSTVVAAIDVPTTYTVTGTNNSGCSSTASIMVDVQTCTGMTDVTYDSQLAVYPNPGSGVFTIAGGSAHKTIVVSDITGRVILSGVYEEKQISFDLSAYSKGLYYVNVNGQTLKLIKE